ncbi:MAG: mechanosensitive ion channel family protein, partial [Rhodothermales bacterium]
MDTIRPYLEYLSAHPYLNAVLVLAGALILARLIDRFMIGLVRRLASRTRSDVDDRILEVLHRPVFQTVMLVGLRIAIETVLPEGQAADVVQGIIKTLMVLIWATATIRLTSVVLRWMSSNEDRFRAVQMPTVPLFDIVAKVVIFGIGSYLIMLNWDINVSGWLASAGIVGLGVGLAAQETFANLFAGVSILADSPYKIGDFIVLDGSERGRVTQIGLRSTRILTLDQVEVTVPNAIIANSKIINESGGPSRRQRMRVPFGVAYGTRIEDMEPLIMAAAKSDESVLETPEPRVHFKGFGDSSLDFEVRCWIERPEEREQIVNRINRAIYRTLNEAGIEIPFPKRDLYIKEWPERLLR